MFLRSLVLMLLLQLPEITSGKEKDAAIRQSQEQYPMQESSEPKQHESQAEKIQRGNVMSNLELTEHQSSTGYVDPVGRILQHDEKIVQGNVAAGKARENKHDYGLAERYRSIRKKSPEIQAQNWRHRIGKRDPVKPDSKETENRAYYLGPEEQTSSQMDPACFKGPIEDNVKAIKSGRGEVRETEKRTEIVLVEEKGKMGERMRGSKKTDDGGREIVKEGERKIEGEQKIVKEWIKGSGKVMNQMSWKNEGGNTLKERSRGEERKMNEWKDIVNEQLERKEKSIKMVGKRKESRRKSTEIVMNRTPLVMKDMRREKGVMVSTKIKEIIST